MNLDYIKDRLTNKQEMIPTVLLGVSVLCGILILVKVTSFFVASARAESIVKQAVEQSRSDQKNLEKQLADSAEISNELKQNNLFAPPVPKKHPVTEVSGIFGDQVLIKNKWYGVGDSIADAKIVAIGPTSVTIVWDGKEKTFLPIQAKAGAANGQRAGGTARANADENNKQENGGNAPETVVVQNEGERPRFGGRGGPGGGFTAMRQRFENMSEEERQAFRDRMRARFDRNRNGSGGRRMFGPGGRGPGGR
jgi:hypothetical protein